jgi:hypothetical protein
MTDMIRTNNFAGVIRRTLALFLTLAMGANAAILYVGLTG